MSGTKWLQRREHFDWMQKCLVCWQKCEEFSESSIQNGEFISSINTCRDATEMCSQCIKFESQRSPFFKQLCLVCAEICEKFAFELEKLESKTEIVSETIAPCKTFAAACRQIGEEKVNISNANSKITRNGGNGI